MPHVVNPMWIRRSVEAALVVALCVVYLDRFFGLGGTTFWTAGLGDWMDPYLVNFLLEHCYRSLLGFSDLSSPPMFHPTPGTLGYSVGLVLYAPFYVAIRPFAHPFQAHGLALFAVFLVGLLCLYVLLRWAVRLPVIESAGLTALFATSANVLNGLMGTWSHRGSVFLVPPILLLALASRRMRSRRMQVTLAWTSGLLIGLLFVQDFTSALLALVVAALACAPALAIAAARLWREGSSWRRGLSPAATPALLVALIAALWTLFVWMTGGGTLHALGLSLSSRDWRRPAVIALTALAVFVWVDRGITLKSVFHRAGSWNRALAAGALAGFAIFFWIYVGAFRDLRGFPVSDLFEGLVQRDTSSWRGLRDVLAALAPFDSMRSFLLVPGLAALAWIPWFKVDRTTRLYGLWFAVVSLFVVLAALAFDGFSLWRIVFYPLPGFSAVRDPKRIVYAYELAVVFACGLFLARLPRTAVLRRLSTAIIVVLLVAIPNRETFDFLRPNETYARWVDAPIRIDPSCRSFFVAPASARYTTRPNAAGTMYSLDAMFVALNTGVPTLQGYSAFTPADWHLGDPGDPRYADAVAQWVARHDLAGVCEFDLEPRVMVPWPRDGRQ